MNIIFLLFMLFHSLFYYKMNAMSIDDLERELFDQTGHIIYLENVMPKQLESTSENQDYPEYSTMDHSRLLSQNLFNELDSTLCYYDHSYNSSAFPSPANLQNMPTHIRILQKNKKNWFNEKKEYENLIRNKILKQMINESCTLNKKELLESWLLSFLKKLYNAKKTSLSKKKEKITNEFIKKFVNNNYFTPELKKNLIDTTQYQQLYLIHLSAKHGIYKLIQELSKLKCNLLIKDGTEKTALFYLPAKSIKLNKLLKQ